METKQFTRRSFIGATGAVALASMAAMAMMIQASAMGICTCVQGQGFSATDSEGNRKDYTTWVSTTTGTPRSTSRWATRQSTRMQAHRSTSTTKATYTRRRFRRGSGRDVRCAEQ